MIENDQINYEKTGEIEQKQVKIQKLTEINKFNKGKCKCFIIFNKSEFNQALNNIRSWWSR